MQTLYHIGEPLSVMFSGSFTPNLKASTWQVWITNQFEDYHKGCAYGASLPNGKNGIAMQL